jgi:hypothetical protein
MAALRRLWQEPRSARFALLAFLAALLTSAGWLGYFVRTDEEGLVEALVLLAIPVVSTAAALALRRWPLGEAAFLLSAALLVLFQGLLGLSFGFSYLPAAVLMVVAAVSLLTERGGARGAPAADRGRGGRLTRAALAVTCLAAAVSWLDMRYAVANWGAEFTAVTQIVFLMLPVALVGAAVAFERTGLRAIARLAAAGGLLVLGVVGLPAMVAGLLGLPAVALLVVAAMLDLRGAPPAHDQPHSPQPRQG